MYGDDQGRTCVGTTCKVEETTRGSPGSGKEREASLRPWRWHQAWAKREAGIGCEDLGLGIAGRGLQLSGCI